MGVQQAGVTLEASRPVPCSCMLAHFASLGVGWFVNKAKPPLLPWPSFVPQLTLILSCDPGGLRLGWEARRGPVRGRSDSGKRGHCG